MTQHALYPINFDRTVRVGLSPYRLLHFTDAEGPAAWGFEHVCGSWPDDTEPDGMFVKRVAPRLTNHTVTETAPGIITVRASILCPDCGVHGFVTDSEWSNA